MLEQLNDLSRFEQDLHEKHIEYCCRTCKSLREIGAKFIVYERENKNLPITKKGRCFKANMGLVFTRDSIFYKGHTTNLIAHEWGVYEAMIKETQIDNIIYDLQTQFDAKIDNIIYTTHIPIDMPNKTELSIPQEFLSGVTLISTKKDGTPFKNGSSKVTNTTNDLRAFLMNARMKGKDYVAVDGKGLQYWLWDIENEQSGEKFAMVMCKPYP